MKAPFKISANIGVYKIAGRLEPDGMLMGLFFQTTRYSGVDFFCLAISQ
jgi:hypothetical protein